MEKLFKEKTGYNFNDYYKNTKSKLIWFLKEKTDKDYDLEGIADIAFVKLLNNIETFDNTKQLNTLLYTIALNDLKMEYRLDRIKTSNFNEQIFNIKDDIENYDESVEYKFNALKTHLNHFDEITKNIFWLKYNGKTFNEISNILNINVNSVKTKFYSIKNGKK